MTDTHAPFQAKIVCVRDGAEGVHVRNWANCRLTLDKTRIKVDVLLPQEPKTESEWETQCALLEYVKPPLDGTWVLEMAGIWSEGFDGNGEYWAGCVPHLLDWTLLKGKHGPMHPAGEVSRLGVLNEAFNSLNTFVKVSLENIIKFTGSGPRYTSRLRRIADIAMVTLGYTPGQCQEVHKKHERQTEAEYIRRGKPRPNP